MTQLPGWLLKNGKTIALDRIETLLGPVAQLAKEWKPVGQRLLELGKQAPLHAPLPLVEFVLANLEDEAVAKVLDEIDDGLPGKLADAKTAFEDSQWSKMIRPVGELTETYLPKGAEEGRIVNHGSNEGLISLSPPEADADGSSDLGPAALTCGVAAGASLAIEAGSVWPFQSDKVAPGLLRIGLSGHISGKTGADVPLAVWASFGASASAEAEGEIGYFYRPKAETVFAEAVVPALGGLANPADLQALANAMALEGLEGLVLYVNGAARAEAEATLGRDFAIEGIASGKIGLSGSVSFARESRWVLSLRRNGSAYDVVLSRLRSSERGWEAGAAISAEVSGLAAKANGALDKLTALAGPKLEEIKPFLSPGTYAREQLEDLFDDTVAGLVADETLAEAIGTDLGLLLGENAGDGLAVEAWLQARLAAALDEVATEITDKAEGYSEKVTERLLEHVPGFVPEDLKAEGKAKVEALVAGLKGEFDTRWKELTRTRTLTRQLSQELKDIGVGLSGAMDDADTALAGVRKLIAAYEAFTEDVREKLKIAAEKEIGLRIGAEYAQSASTHYEVLGTITEINPATREIWRQLATGRLQAVQRMLADPALVPKGFVLSGDSSLSLLASSRRGLAFSLDLLGDVVKFETHASGKASISIGGGKITVNASAEAQRSLSIFGTSREANFLSVYDLQSFKAGGGQRSLALSIDFIRRDDDLKESELGAFLVRLVENNLVSQTRADRAKELLQNADHAVGSGKLKGEVGFRMSLSPQQTGNMLALGSQVAADRTVHRALFMLAARLLDEAGFGTRSRLTEDFDSLMRQPGEGDRYERLYRYRDGLPRFGARSRGQRRTGSVRTYSELGRLLDLANALPEMFRIVAKTHAVLPETPMQDGWDVDRYRKEQQELAKAGQAWIKLKEWFKPELHPAMVILLRLLVALEEGTVPREPAGARDYVAAMGRPRAAVLNDRLLALSLQLGDADKPTVI